MSRVVNKEVTKITIQNEDVTETIDYIFINKNGWIQWMVRDYDSEGNLLNNDPRWYAYPANDAELMGTFFEGANTTYEDIQGKLWAKVDEIEAMPEENEEQIEEKRKYIGSECAFKIDTRKGNLEE